jgi:hypothetical protein
MMTERIEGKVAQLLSARELVINRGAEAGVKVGMRFAVLDSNAPEVVDPETGQSLGKVDVAKTLVKVVRIFPHMSVARTFRTYETGGAFASLMAREKYVERIGSTEENLAHPDLSEPANVEVGDRAVQAVGEEFDDSM